MKELQILMDFAKDSKSEVIRRANGSHSLSSSEWSNLKNAVRNVLNKK
tara:strand:- start:441 stop:584 length:144 start_codon:yes stop_codon:yes gene_type:complete